MNFDDIRWQDWAQIQECSQLRAASPRPSPEFSDSDEQTRNITETKTDPFQTLP